MRRRETCLHVLQKVSQNAKLHLRGRSKISTRENWIDVGETGGVLEALKRHKIRQGGGSCGARRLRVLVQQDTQLEVVDCPHSTPGLRLLGLRPVSIPAVKNIC